MNKPTLSSSTLKPEPCEEHNRIGCDHREPYTEQAKKSGSTTAGDEQIQTKDLVTIDEKKDTGDDSMKELREIVKEIVKLEGAKWEDIYQARDNLIALFQSQHSKTLERVREKIKEEITISTTDEYDSFALGQIGAFNRVLAILEAEKEQKGSK